MAWKVDPRFCEYEEKNCVHLHAAGRRTQLFHHIFTEPGVHLIGHPCILNWYSPKVWSSLRKNSIVPTDALPQGRREPQLCAFLCSLLLSKGSCKKTLQIWFYLPTSAAWTQAANAQPISWNELLNLEGTFLLKPAPNLIVWCVILNLPHNVTSLRVKRGLGKTRQGLVLDKG